MKALDLKSLLQLWPFQSNRKLQATMPESLRVVAPDSTMPGIFRDTIIIKEKSALTNKVPVKDGSVELKDGTPLEKWTDQ